LASSIGGGNASGCERGAAGGIRGGLKILYALGRGIARKNNYYEHMVKFCFQGAAVFFLGTGQTHHLTRGRALAQYAVEMCIAKDVCLELLCNQRCAIILARVWATSWLPRKSIHRSICKVNKINIVFLKRLCISCGRSNFWTRNGGKVVLPPCCSRCVLTIVFERLRGLLSMP
jgi:hypothetical protein